MQKKKKQKQQRQLILPLACIVLLLLSAACFGAWQWLSNLLESQKEAERWQGDGEMAFSQISCFLPADKQIGLREVADFRNAAMAKLKEASLDITGDQHLMLDAWSTSGKVYTSGEHGRGEIICNTTRYNYGKMMDLMLKYGSRGAQTSGAVLPYWENAARMTEDWGSLACLWGTVFLIFPVVVGTVWLVRSSKHVKQRFEDDYWPTMKERTEEAVRVRQRKRWERKHQENE